MSTVLNKGLPTKGFKRLVYWPMVNEDTESYGQAKESPANVKIDVAITNTEGEFSANDQVMVADNEFAYATVTLELGNETKQMEADIHGHTIDPATGNLVCNANDKAPYVALAYEVPLSGSISAYRLLPKVKFGIGNESASSKQSNSITYGTKTITGKAIAMKNGTWCNKAETGDSNVAQWFINPQLPNLSAIVDKGILDLVIAKAKSINTIGFTEPTVTALTNALEAAETIFTTISVTDVQVNTAASSLLDAILALATA